MHNKFCFHQSKTIFSRKKKIFSGFFHPKQLRNKKIENGAKIHFIQDLCFLERFFHFSHVFPKIEKNVKDTLLFIAALIEFFYGSNV